MPAVFAGKRLPVDKTEWLADIAIDLDLIGCATLRDGPIGIFRRLMRVT